MDKRMIAGTVIIIWAAALQAHMMWLQRQDSFKEKFGKKDE
ncbi:hypothetical protein KP509_17G001600 [Ceratopteris richardii]|uniref:Uncharacterized protein n=1 Tax=Ceratopteris richardii TaxID=49495 RepID=A0A8T2SVD1_CERRI|nr:hypothetical protein KP509_17G001600 [Ceratopteris richardii]